MYIRKFKYTTKDLECEYCAERLRGGKCAHKKCSYIAERVEANAITYGDVLSDIAFSERSINKRPPCLIENHPDSFWLDGLNIAKVNLLRNRMVYFICERRNEMCSKSTFKAFESLMKETPNSHYDSGYDGIYSECRSCRFHRPFWMNRPCVFKECPYSTPRLSTLHTAQEKGKKR